MLDSCSSWPHSWIRPASFLDRKLVSLEVAWIIGHLKGQGGKKATYDRGHCRGQSHKNREDTRQRDMRAS